MTLEIKDGDIFRWRYKDEKPEDRGEYRRYHCKSQIAVAREGSLVDTYWFGNSDGYLCGYADAAEKLQLDYVGNFSDLVSTREYVAQYYDDADCVNLNHANSTKDNFYIRVGASRSKSKMLATIEQKIRDEEATIRVASSHITSLTNERLKIESGTPLDEIHI